MSDTTAPADPAATGDSANQDQSGVTNTETGQSELGDDATKTTPDQGEPVTAKGDTVGTSGADAALTPRSRDRRAFQSQRAGKVPALSVSSSACPSAMRPGVTGPPRNSSTTSRVGRSMPNR